MQTNSAAFRRWMISVAVFCACGVGPASAADKSGVSPNSISVPSGPGSIEGLGEAFQPSLNTGTAKYGLGLKLPPGTAGHAPGLALRYDSGSGNGPLGFDWSISLPRIQRRTDKGIPTYGADVGVARSDTFINEAKEELVPRADGFFFCENESAFVRYRRAGAHWEGTRPDGTRLEFGLTAAGRIEESATGRVFAWLLERETDTRGNVIEYVYRSFPGDENLNQKYLALVRYGPGVPTWTHFHFAAFEYENRNDWFEDGRAGFFVRTGKRLKSVVIGTQGAPLPGHLAGDFSGDGTPDYLNRRYDLAYLRYAGTNSHWSLLEKVTLVGADGVTSLPPAKFGYDVFNPPTVISAAGRVWGGIDEPLSVMDNSLVEFADLNADGLPDVLMTEGGGGGHIVYLNRGATQVNGASFIQWASPVAVDPGAGAAWNFDLASDNTHLADMDGDGLADLVHKSADEAVFYFANRGKIRWSTRVDMALAGPAPPAPFGNAGVRTADVDFDKRIDVVQSVDFGGAIGYRVWFNLGDGEYASPVTVEPEGGFDLALPDVQVVDLNGDRVPDVARVRPGAVLLAGGLGYGRFAAPRGMVLPDITLDDAQVASAKLTDISGDGLADLVLERAAPGECWFWLNLGNDSFSERRRITGLPANFSQHTAVRWADLNGNGTTDLIYADSSGTPRLQMIELSEITGGGLAPNLLRRIENGIGSVTHIHYAPSTQFALADAANGQPWPDALPFPVTVVESIRLSDSLGHEYLTRFRYHDGYYDAVEKQFRGFARVEKIEVGDDTSPTLVSRSYFDTGRSYDAMKGQLLRATEETETGEVFWDEVTVWSEPPRALMTGTNGVVVRFAHPLGNAKDILERGQGTRRRLESEFEFDDYGNQTRVADFGIVEGVNRSAFDDERIRVTEYATNLDAWIVRLPKRESIQDEHGAVISRAEMFYDDEAFAGNNFGAVNVGNLTMRREWIDPQSPTNFIPAARTRFDVFGNPTVLFDPLADPGTPARGHFRELAYDAPFHSYVVRETVHVRNGAPLEFAAEYDAGLAVMTNATDLNGHVTRLGHDGFGRLVRLVRPGDTDAFSTVEYDYALAVPVGSNHVVNFTETRRLDRGVGSAGSKRDHYFISRQYTDGLGRPVMTRTEAEPAPGSSAPRVAVSGVTLFNARRQTSRTLAPFFTTRTGALEALLEFEEVEAPGWQGQFHESGNLALLNLTAAHQVRTEYDATMRAVKVTNADKTLRRIDYEPLVTRAFDEHDSDPASPHFNTPAVQFSDGLGRNIRTDEVVRLNDDGTPAAALRTWITRYEFDLNDRLTRITDAQENVKLMGYDGLGRKVWMNDPDAGVSTNIYDAASNMIETRDAKGQRITYTYDGANRVLTEDHHDESATVSYGRTPDVTFHYDVAAGAVDQGDGTRATARNTKGLLAWVEDPSGEEHTSYDERGRREWTVKRIVDPWLAPDLVPRASALVSYRTAFSHDAMDRVRRLVYPDGDEVTQSYNARSLIESIAGGPNGHVIAHAIYLPSGQPGQIDHGNSVRTRHDYDARARVERILTQRVPGGAEWVHFGYALDAVSNIRAIADRRPLAEVPASDARRNAQVFAYDDLYRLTRAEFNPPNPAGANGGAIQFRYDRIGNLLAQTSSIAHVERGVPVTDLGNMSFGGTAGAAGRVGRAPGAGSGPHALTGVAGREFTYDANGNMTAMDGLACTWDFRNRLVAVEDDTMRADYRYDFLGRRIVKRVVWKGDGSDASEGTTFTLYPGTHFEVRDHDQPVKYVFNGSTRVARITGTLTLTNARVQRLRLRAGWNLVSLAVSAEDLLEQLNGPAPGELIVSSAYRWDAASSGYAGVGAGESVSAGMVLWLKANTSRVVSVTGTYLEPGARRVPAGGAYIAGPGLEAWSLDSASMLTAWAFAPGTRDWRAQFAGELSALSDLPETLPVGGAFYVVAEEPVELAIPRPAQRIVFYHGDHLGSASVATDANGELWEETAYYPFGVPRHEHRLAAVETHYGFTQKERDRESGLHYFEARYLAGALARFIAPDEKYAHLDALGPADMTAFLSRPQKLNLYMYALNNPLRYNDPSGFDDVDKVTTGVDVFAAGMGVAEEVVIFGFKTADGLGDVGAIAGKTTAVISVGVKGVQFINDPSMATGGQLLNEGAKTLTGFAAPPVALVWAIADLTGYGPSAILEHTEKSIQANRAATRAYKETTATYRQMTKQLLEAERTIRPRLESISAKVDYLNKAAKEVKAKNDETLRLMDDEIKRLEKQNKALKREMIRQEKRARELEAE